MAKTKINRLPVFLSQAVMLIFMLQVMSSSAWAVPPCLDGNTPIAVDNQQVLRWKQSTQNGYRARSHIFGVLKQIFPDQNGHHHLEVVIGSNPSDILEVIYNEDFGGVPTLYPGMNIEACGDYITSIAPSGPYPASPDGAILHWVHISPDLNRHESGYLAINGYVCGQEVGRAGPKPYSGPHQVTRPSYWVPR